jgi:hypothetical protein
VEDCRKRKPIDIARQKNNSSIVDILENISKWNIYNVNKQYLKDSWIYSCLFVVFFSLIEIILIMSVFPFISILNMKISLILLLLLMLSYIRLYFSDPGFKKIKINKSFKSLIADGINLTDICPYCIDSITEKTVHCYNCNKCVDNYDHHCIWISNCVGEKNIKYFILFLALCIIKILFNITNCLHSNIYFIIII